MKKYYISAILLGVCFSLSTVSAMTSIAVPVSAGITGDVAPDEASSGCTDLSYNLTYKKSKDSNTNGEVSDLQYFLQDQDLLNVEPNGVFGPATLKAVKYFQKKNGFITSGYVGPMTRAKIKEISCNQNNDNVSSSNQETDNKKVCKAIGTKSEGWYDSVTNELIDYANCSNTSTKPVACTMEYRSCADGSAMPRDADCKWREDKCANISLNNQISVDAYFSPSSISTGKDSSTLYWQSKNATFCSFVSQTSSLNIGKVYDKSGTISVGMFENIGVKTVTITCYNPSGQSETKTAVLSVGSSVSESKSINILSPTAGMTFKQGQPMTISWSPTSPNAKYTVSYADPGPTIGTFSASDAHCASSDKCYIYWTPTFSDSNLRVTVMDQVSGYQGIFTTSIVSPVSLAPVIKEVRGKGGFGTGNGDSNSIIGENLGNVKEVYLESADSGKRISLKFSFRTDADRNNEIIGITIPNDISYGKYFIVANSADMSSGPYSVGYLGTIVLSTTQESTKPSIDSSCTQNINTSTPISTTNSVGTVTVTSPNGGNCFTKGSSQTITWTNSVEIDKVTIMYVAANGVAGYVASNIPNTGLYNWNVNVGNTTNTQYKIMIIAYKTGTGSVTDSSDNYFTVPSPFSVVNPIRTSGSNSVLSLVKPSSVVLGASTMCVDISRNLHRGAESSSVTTLQKFLQNKGLLSEVSGFYGDKTIEAVKDYQSSKGLVPTGMVYEVTRQAVRDETCQ